MNFEKMFDDINANMQKPEKEYTGEDGLLHCAVCHRNTQTVVEFLGITKTVRCICDCKVKELEAEKELQRRIENHKRRQACFAGKPDMMEWTFANDDRKNAKLSDAMRNYAEKFTEFRRNGKGLLLFGTVSTGKSFFAACIANSLIDKGYSVTMRNFVQITNKLQGMFEGKQEYIDSLNDFDLVIFDDLGAERQTDFVQETVFNIIDTRLGAGLPCIITTNLTADEIKNPPDITHQRIYERILKMCHPIEVAGASRRRAELKETHADVKAMLGL